MRRGRGQDRRHAAARAADLDEREAAASIALDDATSALTDAEGRHVQYHRPAPAHDEDTSVRGQARTGNKRAASDSADGADQPADKDARRSNRVAGRPACAVVTPPAGRANAAAPADPALEKATASQRAVAEREEEEGGRGRAEGPG